MKTFEGKVVVITGAGSGLGRAYAREFANRGAVLALNDYDSSSLRDTCALMPPRTKTFSSAFDVSDRDAMYRFADDVAAAVGPAHVVINNAGIAGVGAPAWALADKDFERLMAVDFFSVVHGTRAFLPHLRENADGAIVNISSLFGLTGAPNKSDYCAAKFAVRGFTEALMVEMTREPVSVHLVHPGGTATNISNNTGDTGFSDHFLRTDPADVAVGTAEAILKGRPRLVVAHAAFKTQVASSFLPRRLMNRILWHQLAPVIDTSQYPGTAARRAPRSTWPFH